MSRFDYVKYDDLAAKVQDHFKKICVELERDIQELIPGQASGRSVALALTKVEEAYMWIGKAIRDNQIVRNGSAQLQEERKDG